MKTQSLRKNVFKYLGTASLFFCLAVLGFNCSKFSGKTELSSSGASISSVEAEPTIGLMSADQMLKGMISVTSTEGLGEFTDAADVAIDNVFSERNGALPASQDIFQATAPTLVSATNLASAVCAKAVDRDRATAEASRDSRLFFREIDFSKGLSGQDSNSISQAFSRIARSAWRREVSAAEISAIVTFAQEFSSGVDANDSEQTRLLAIALCSVAVSAIDALTF